MRRLSKRPAVALAALTLAGALAHTSAGTEPCGLDWRPESGAFLNLPADEPRALPPLLSQTGAFKDIEKLLPSAALIPYDLNVPFWSDGATKSRWIAVPYGGSGKAGRIGFSPTGEWTFPEGTVFVKHFELAIDERRPNAKRRLETRLLVCDSQGGVYGASYKWRADNRDAEIVKGPLHESIVIKTAAGARRRNWYYPGPEDCGKCHVASAGKVLGVNTRQLNRDYAYPTGVTDNQLRTWSHIGLFESKLDEAEIPHFSRLAPPDDATRSVEDRARAYLDANCAYCHRPGGVVADFDARYETPLAKQNLVDVPVRINLGIDRARFIAPNDIWRSIVLLRLNTVEAAKMPPLAHEVVDRQGAELLKAWITSLPGPQVVAPPSIAPEGGEYGAPVRVTLAHNDPATIIRYTLDGTVPRESSQRYIEPLEITGPTTVRARGFRRGRTRSITVHETFIIGE